MRYDYKSSRHLKDKPDCSVSDIAELIVLDKYSNKKYLDKFPWQL